MCVCICRCESYHHLSRFEGSLAYDDARFGGRECGVVVLMVWSCNSFYTAFVCCVTLAIFKDVKLQILRQCPFSLVLSSLIWFFFS